MTFFKKYIFNLYLRSSLSRWTVAVFLWEKLNKYSLHALGIDNFDEKGVLTGERSMVRYVTRKFKPKVLVDVGANVGGYSSMFKEFDPEIRIIGFEPHPHNFQQLTHNLKDHKDCSFYQYGVGNPSDEAGELLPLFDYEPGRGSPHASFHPRSFSNAYGVQTSDLSKTYVNMVSLNDFLLCKLKYIDFLKIDTEGFELEVLKGASRFVQHGKIGFIHFEFNHTHIQKAFFSDFWAMLQKHYTLYRLLPNGFMRIPYYCVEHEVFKYQNFLAVNKAIKF